MFYFPLLSDLLKICILINTTPQVYRDSDWQDHVLCKQVLVP